MNLNATEGPTSRGGLATLGGGCFWCTEAVFSELRGVLKVQSGYAGGQVVNPSYEQVTTGTTGHAEVVQVTFDPAQISYAEVLEIFFTTHDPTTLDREGNDVGPQYRSVIFYHTENQKTVASQVIAKFEGDKIFDNPIVTTIEPFTAFYQAEGFHDRYFALNPELAYCRIIIVPKIRKLREHFRDKIREP